MMNSIKDRTTPNNIRKLKSNDVFVFGTNEDGFHGAGAAGLAFRGNSDNNWRNDDFFIRAMNSDIDSKNRIGKWAVYGISRGFMIGIEGKSYGIVTIETPSKKRSVSLGDINNQVEKFIEFTKSMKSHTFLVTEIGCNYAGYTVDEIAPLFIKCINIDNIKLPNSFWSYYSMMKIL